MDSKIVKIHDIDLKEFQKFYDEFLLDKTFRYTIYPHKSKTTKILDIRFFEENLPHLLGIHKLAPQYEQKLYKGKLAYDGIKNRTVFLSDLIGSGKQRPKEKRMLSKIERRLAHFYYIEDLLVEDKMIKYQKSNYSSIESEFILYHDRLNIRIHLGVKKQQIEVNNNIFIPETFFVEKMRRGNIYTDCPPNVYMNIEKIEVIE